jgi:hypothetical protein
LVLVRSSWKLHRNRNGKPCVHEDERADLRGRRNPSHRKQVRERVHSNQKQLRKKPS